MRRRRLIAGAASLGGLWALGPLLSACGGDGGAKPAKAEEARSSVARATPGATAAADARTLAEANAAFGWGLYRQLATAGAENLFLSPYSIGFAMAMVHAGARGATQQQLARALRFDAIAGGPDAAFNALAQGIQRAASVPARTATTAGEPAPFVLSQANSAWAQSGYAFLPAYLDTLARYYGAGVHLTDFQKSPEQGRKAVNSWVGDQTATRIPELLPEGSIDTLTRLVLANAIYFKGDWATPFEQENTAPADFHILGGETKPVATMRHTGSYAYASANGVEALALPYAGGSVSMVVLLPAAGGLSALESDVGAVTGKLLPSMTNRQVRVAIPKWQFSSAFDLVESLKKLGAIDVFDADLADLSGMDGKPDLYISGVYHKAFVKVDEKGTEAAAATGAVARATSALVDQPLAFTADRPFLFVITERQTGAVLFAGRVVDPSLGA